MIRRPKTKTLSAKEGKTQKGSPDESNGWSSDGDGWSIYQSKAQQKQKGKGGKEKGE